MADKALAPIHQNRYDESYDLNWLGESRIIRDFTSGLSIRGDHVPPPSGVRRADEPTVRLRGVTP